MVRTTLAARAHTSRSDDTESRVILRHETKEGDKSEMSWRHSTASVRRMARVMSRDLGEMLSPMHDRHRTETYARARELLAAALVQSALTRFSSSLPTLWIFPGWFAT